MRYSWLLLVLVLLPVQGFAQPFGRAVAFEAERRMFIGIGGATSQSRFRADGEAGGNLNTLSDTPVLRVGRYGRPTRYGVDLMRVNYNEAETWYGTAFLDLVIPGGEMFSGYVGVAAGWGSMRWRRNDVLGGDGNFGAKGTRTGSWLAGFRAGGLIEVTDLVQVEIGYRFLFADFEERFSDGTTTVTAVSKNQRAVHAGVNFRF
ncbi:MAG: hypothetical protein JJU06_07230 [Ectothiorhodospiraceae bacterium]|nr:hypothetical protein [Ectothiorhodospiraceae bacterium]MCH8505355.1 hypothetical protein [Ectothiorhodospiraceae bacterium]